MKYRMVGKDFSVIKTCNAMIITKTMWLFSKNRQISMSQNEDPPNIPKTYGNLI